MLRLVVVGTGIVACVAQVGCRIEAPYASEFASQDGTGSSSGLAEPSTSAEPPADGTTEAGTHGTGTGDTGTTMALGTDGTESSTTEAGTTESSTTESSTTDSGTTDSGTTDSGTTDSGDPVCGDGLPEGMEECDAAGESATCDVDCTLALCGDGTVNPTAAEQCDDAGPSATCDADCTLVACGDSTLNPLAGEACDTAELGGQSCAGLGFDGGTLACNALCQLDTTGCGLCGDGAATRGEPCDGLDLAGQTCASLGFTGGNLACTPACTLDTGDCYGCNDGVVDPGEECDSFELNGQTCTGLGFDGGSLACTGVCTFDTSGCHACGDGSVDPGEACDGLDLVGQTCASQGFGGGLLACSPDCTFDTSGCWLCGDGTANPGEACDGLDLAGQTCVSQGFSGGYLGCDGACNYDTSGCCISGNIIDFGNGADVAGWVVTDLNGTGAGWGLYDEAPPNTSAGPVPFPNAPVYGTDSNRVPPYPGSHAEHSQVVTSPVEIPLQVSFSSWNVDEGTNPYDTKRIEISVDGGATWSTLVDCTLDATPPFCAFVSDGRAPDDWDFIVLDTSPWAGMSGQLRFTYNTVDACCSFERGWFIDDLSLCAAP